MAIDLNVDLDQVEQKQGGKGLRRLLEAALDENKGLRGVAVTAEAVKVIGENNYHLIDADALEGVDLKLIPAKAKELQEAAVQAQRESVSDILAGKGLEGEALDKAVTEFIGPAPEASKSKFGNVHESAAADGKPTPAVDASQLHGVAAIEHVLGGGK